MKTLNLKKTFGKQRKWREKLFHFGRNPNFVKYEKYATQVLDVVAYEYYECFSSQLNTLIHIIANEPAERRREAGEAAAL